LHPKRKKHAQFLHLQCNHHFCDKPSSSECTGNHKASIVSNKTDCMATPVGASTSDSSSTNPTQPLEEHYRIEEVMHMMTPLQRDNSPTDSTKPTQCTKEHSRNVPECSKEIILTSTTKTPKKSKVGKTKKT
jgi:hypothetical protein